MKEIHQFVNGFENVGLLSAQGVKFYNQKEKNSATVLKTTWKFLLAFCFFNFSSETKMSLKSVCSHFFGLFGKIRAV